MIFLNNERIDGDNILDKMILNKLNGQSVPSVLN